MREIKFRLWHRKNKAMYAHNFMWGSPSLHGGGYVRCVPFGDGLRHDFMGYGNEIQIEPQECEIMQFTGLHDKNGNEIYEGDVLESPDWACLSIVEWRKGGFVIPQGEYGNIIGYELESHYERYPDSAVRVIGNIYENGDLLT